MNLLQRAAFVTLVSFLPIALGCSSTPEGDDPAAEQAADGASLAVVGGEGETKRAFTQEEIDGVLGNTTEFSVDGVKTTDFSKVLTAQRVDVDAGNGRTATLLRNGNRLELDVRSRA
ncbi:MAG: hypothetical protein KF819_15660 [Labilithrix sp.]|nr:hypothetical protein [Labilithrix sp.]